MRGPLVSAIMPSIRNPTAAIRCFDAQTYKRAELVMVRSINAEPFGLFARGQNVIVPDGLALGELRNVTIRQSRGSLIVHWDDDDWYAPDRLERIVAALRDAPICGSSLVRLKDTQNKKQWRWDGSQLRDLRGHARLYGAALAYRRSIWERQNFDPYQHVGEDSKWLQSLAVSGYRDFKDASMSTHYVDGTNTGGKVPSAPCWTEEPYEEDAQ